MDRGLKLTLGATAQVGIAVALAPAFPAPIRSWVLLIALLVWGAGIAVGVTAVVRMVRAVGTSDPRTRLALAVGAAGIGLGALAVAQHTIVRSLPSNGALVWGADWRYALNHAQAIARTGGVDAALDYAGAPVSYHVGPAWLAGAAGRLLGTGVDVVLFGVVPLLGFLAVALACVALLVRAGLPPGLAVLSVGVAVWVPGLAAALPESLTVLARRLTLAVQHPRLLRDPEMWLFTSLMSNSQFALAVGLAGVALILGERPGVAQLVAGAAALASTVEVKPQYFAGLGLFAALVGLTRLSTSSHPRREAGPVVALVGALGLAVALSAMLPGLEGVLLAPTWAPGASPYSLNHALHEALRTPALLMLAALVLSVYAKVSRGLELRRSPLFALFVGSGVALALACTFFYTAGIPFRPELMRRALSFGFGEGLTAGFQADVMQALIPLRFLAALSGVAVVVLAVAAYSARAAAGWAVLGTLLMLGPAFHVASAFAEPRRAYEAAEDAELQQVLARVGRSNELIVASDLADQAQEYKRPLQGLLLTAYGGHRFFVSNLRNVHLVREDAARRLHHLRVFFGSEWTPWHRRWLETAGITHVLVNNRCVPAWWGDGGLPLRVVAGNAKWTALAVTASPGARAEAVAEPRWEDLRPSYGRSECLLPGWSPDWRPSPRR